MGKYFPYIYPIQKKIEENNYGFILNAKLYKPQKITENNIIVNTVITKHLKWGTNKDGEEVGFPDFRTA